ncbi:eukaryotic integral membrane protein-domain-containing protein [Sphaerosporella brunnea]|uniref:Eukaryotic integral membrane protein-domain-containing protein n=1 Tax=Sphaerosporella brunnea TaxID=1250544 RepID=A0A5J5EFV1_9PEZI|nr:eukaryotic integral membrane protein-domain-containing protein [Sphaerosporella brunnea]
MPRVNVPPLTRICLILCTALSILAGALRYRAWISQRSDSDSDSDSGTPSDSQSFTIPYLTVVPALSVVYPWTFLTSSIVESNIFTLATTLATLFYGGKYLERAWGSEEFGKFLLVVSIVPNFLAFVLYIVWFAVTGNSVRSFTTICGGIALQAGFLVALKQLVPEHTVTLFKGIVKIRVKHFPALFLLVNTLSGPVFGTDVAAILAWLGFLSSWTYLRFYKRSFPDLGSNQAPSLKGDASEIFAIAYFFPDPIHRPVAIISNVVYNLLVAIKICTPFSAADVSASNNQAQARDGANLSTLLGHGPGSRVGSARVESERRRALALKALDQQLHAAANKNHSGGASAVLGETSLNHQEGQS